MNANCENKSIDMISNPVEKLKQQLIAAGQEHIFDSLPQLNEKSNIFLQLTQECSNWKELLDNYAAAKRTNPIDLSTVTPLEPHNVMDWTQTSQENKKVVWNIGLEAISNSEVAAVIMSGGQGTRLGFDGPKGMYDIGLPSKKSIFQIHIEKIIGVRQLAQNRQQKADNVLPSIPIYIMTSSQNDHIIREYFRVNDYFNYPKDDVVFFAQALQPCLTTDGKIIIESEDTLSMAPDGNGGLYQALQVSGCLTNILERRIKHLHIYGVDNMLTKSVDPAFIGLCIQSHSECGNKVVW